MIDFGSCEDLEALHLRSDLNGLSHCGGDICLASEVAYICLYMYNENGVYVMFDMGIAS